MTCTYCNRPDCDQPDGEPCNQRIAERGKNPLISRVRTAYFDEAANIRPDSVEAALEDFIKQVGRAHPARCNCIQCNPWEA